jgi:hypothetical protein
MEAIVLIEFICIKNFIILKKYDKVRFKVRIMENI